MTSNDPHVRFVHALESSQKLRKLGLKCIINEKQCARHPSGPWKWSASALIYSEAHGVEKSLKTHLKHGERPEYTMQLFDVMYHGNGLDAIQEAKETLRLHESLVHAMGYVEQLFDEICGNGGDRTRNERK